MLLVGSTALSSQAAKASFSWLANGEPNLTGYKIHYGTISRSYSAIHDAGLPVVIDGRM
jgi:hypothetical protein